MKIKLVLVGVILSTLLIFIFVSGKTKDLGKTLISSDNSFNPFFAILKKQTVPKIEVPEINGYQINKAYPPLKYDLEKDGVAEDIVAYEKPTGEKFGCPEGPIRLVIYKNEKEVFTISLVDNMVGGLSLEKDLVGDGRDFVVFSSINSGCGSGSTSQNFFITYNQSKAKYETVLKFDTDELSEIYIKDFLTSTPGKEIIVDQGIWEGDEAHFDPHYRRLKIYLWNGREFIYKELGVTKQKYLGDYGGKPQTIEELLKKEPELNNKLKSL